MGQVTIYKCNKCGTEFRGDRELGEGEKANPLSARRVRVGNSSGVVTWGFAEDIEGLCPNCLADFDAFTRMVRAMWFAMFPKGGE